MLLTLWMFPDLGERMFFMLFFMGGVVFSAFSELVTWMFILWYFTGLASGEVVHLDWC